MITSSYPPALWAELFATVTIPTLYFDENNRLAFTNPACAGLFAAEEFPQNGAGIDEVIPWAAEAVHAFLESGVLHSTFEASRPYSETTTHFEIRCGLVKASDGAVKGFTVMVSDITRNKLNEARLRRVEREWQTTFDSAPDLITILDCRHIIIKANRAFAEKVGMPVENVLGAACFRCVHGLDGPPGFCPHVKLMREGHDTVAEVNDERLGGTFLVSCTPIRDEVGTLEGSIHIARDITELKHAQEMMIKNERLNAIAELATGVAHNFNNLLQIIIGGAGVALEDLDHSEYSSVRNTIQEILDSARFGAETVKRLQTFARVRTEETPEQGALFDLSVTIRQALEMSRVWWKTLPEKQGVKISAAWNIEEDCIAKGREHEIFELAVNLIKNAVEAMPAGGDLRARVFGDETHVFFTLSDTGIGIAHDDLKRIFEPFFTTKGFRNTGMGLADAYGAALGHGGELSVRSALGEGTAFQLKLPRAHRAATNTNAPHDEGARPPLTILIVDDMAPVLSMLSHTLSKFATEVRIAQSGSEALAIIRETDVDLVLCDLGMPDMNGWMVGRSVKEYYESVGKPCPHFFLLTGWAGQLDETKQMAESGVLGIIEKPVDLRKLAKLVAQVASERAEKIALRPEFAF